MRKSLLAVLALAACSFLAAQQVMNNDAVIKLVKAGLSDDLIVTTINSSPGAYDTSADAVIALKSAGASDKVIAALIAKAAQPTPAPEPAHTDASNAPKATVHFYRYKQYVGSALRPSVYCDGAELGRIDNGRYLDVKISAGPHTFYSEDKQAGAVMTLEPGKDYFLRTDLQEGFWKGHFRLTEVAPDQGKFDITKLKPLDSKDAVHELPATTPSQ
jgi:hypothetical protein